MIKRFITHLAVAEPSRELDPERRKSLRKLFNPLAVRRMSDLSLMIGEVTNGVEGGKHDEWVYASRFGGTQSLERYLGSFPTPSPLHFQNSIHPGAFDLVSVARRRRSGMLTPLCGLDSLVADALQAALLVPADTVVHVVGGDEFEPWSSGQGWGGEMTFAFYLRLEAGVSSGAMGELSLSPNDHNDASVPELPAFHAALSDRQPLDFYQPERGVFRLTWT
ncbi:MAG: hypothetical protein ACQKBW_05285 [Puniceicoccales bacterium]